MTTAVIAGSVFGGVAVILIAAALVYVFVIKKTAATVGASTIIGPEQLSKGQIE